MKIVYMIDNLNLGGTSLALERLAVGLFKRGHEVHVVSMEGRSVIADRLETLGIPVITMDTGAYYLRKNLPIYFSMATYLSKHRFDVAHTFLLKANLIGPSIAAMADIPVILTTRVSLGYDHKPNHFQMLHFTERNWTDGIVVNGEAVGEVTSLQEKVPMEKIHLLPNGFDVESFKVPKNQALFLKLSLPENAPIIGMVANIRPIKGYEILVSAFHELIQTMSNAHLLIVGNVGFDGGGSFRKLQDQIKNLGLQEKITFFHGCQDVPEALSLLDVALLCSHSEGSSFSLLEYMAAGIPTVATQVGGNGEVIVHGENGLLVPPKDPHALAKAILELLNDKEKANKMAQEAKKLVKKEFGLSLMLDRHEHLYQSLLQKKSLIPS